MKVDISREPTDGEPFPSESAVVPTLLGTPQVGERVNLTCPHCCATGHARVGTVVDRFVYLRCVLCGEVWSMLRPDVQT